MDLRNKTTSECRTVFHSSVDVPNSQVSLYLPAAKKGVHLRDWKSKINLITIASVVKRAFTLTGFSLAKMYWYSRQN